MSGAIAAGHPATADAGALVLAEGGNAVDACIAAAFVAFVTEGPLAGPTGGGFFLVHEPGAPTSLLDCFFAVPRRALGAMDEVVIDFADVRTIMSGAGSALMGIGYSESDNRAREAAERALRSPLIDTEIVGAKGILLSIAGGDDLTLLEVNEAAEVVRAAATDETNIIFGATVDERLNGQVWVTVIATGIGAARRRSITPSFTSEEPRRSAPRDSDTELPSFLRS